MKFNLVLLRRIALWLSIFGIFNFIYDFGFYQSKFTQRWIDGFYFLVLTIGVISTFSRYFYNRHLIRLKVFFFDAVSVLYTLYILYVYLFTGEPFKADSFLEDSAWIALGIVLSFIRESSELKITFKRTIFNPAQLFIISFMLIIILGGLLLMLPKATYTEISFVDAMFTSASAVCVTGLSVVDTGTHFTLLGQSIIMILIQVGGLGILTFASYFSYFFKGGTTYENQLVLSDLNSSKQLGEVFSTLKYIIFITLGIELFAAILIYSSLHSSLFESQSDKIFFSCFHSVSAFNNAGFSTLTNNLYESGFKYNYYLQLVIILSFVLGGLGFPIVVNLLKYLKYRIKLLLFFSTKKAHHKPWMLNLNSRITLITTISITVVAFIAFYFLEYNNTLADHGGFGKIVTALFGATTPRTAGFNTIDNTMMTYPTLMMVFFLMWVGASPQSTGGGIKTSTFAIATLNVLSLAKGKSRIEIFRREISGVSVRRAFAIICLSLMVIGLAIILIAIFDSHLDLKDIAFECFSAYSTVGLSLGITADLTDASKYVLIGVMFVGRISMLSLVIAVFRKVKHKNYSYPKEEITIN